MYSYFMIIFCSLYSVQTDTETKDLNLPTPKTSADDNATPDSWESNPQLKSLWVYRPAYLQSPIIDENDSHTVVLNTPHLVTKLTKPLGFGVDPYFTKDYFEPFERRRKPVTLLAFRKRGAFPRKNVPSSLSHETAELQSPYNEISSLWPNDEIIM